MASPGSAISVVLPFARALPCRGGLWGSGSEAEAPQGSPAVPASLLS